VTVKTPNAQFVLGLERFLLGFKLAHLLNVDFAKVMERETVMERIPFALFAREWVVYLENCQQSFVRNVMVLVVETGMAGHQFV